MTLYTIISRLNGFALDVFGGQTEPETKVYMFNDQGTDNQLWYDDPTTGTIRTKINGFCLDIGDDQKLRIMPYQQGNPNQQWERDPQGYIRNRVNRKKVLDIAGSNKNAGADIRMFDQCQEPKQPNQLWNFEFVGGSAPQLARPVNPEYRVRTTLYTIISRLNGFALDVCEGQTQPGTKVAMFNNHGTDNQLWYDDPTTGTIRTKINGFCLDVGDDQKLRIMPYQQGNPNQQWERDPQGYIRNRVNRNKVLDIARTREFHIVSELNGKVIDIKGGKGEPGDELILWDKHSEGRVKNQLWYVDQQGFIRSALNDYAINGAPGCRTVVEPFNGGQHQTWSLEGQRIVNRSSGEVLDVYKSQRENGATVGSWKWADGANQRWRLEYV